MKKFVKYLFFMISFVIIPAFVVFTISFYIREYTNKPIFYYKKAACISNYNIITFNISNIRYAKVNENCYLFKTTDVSDASYRNVEYIVPKSYFVLILSDVNSYIKKVQYNNKIGYVAADSVEEVDFIPTAPFLSGATFDVEDNVGTQLRSSPTAENNLNVITLIPAGTKSITYIASSIGAVPTGGTSAIWYYAIYSPSSDPTSVYEGYVYSGKTLNLSEIPDNLEGVYNDETSEESSEKGFVLNENIKTILIIVICIPIVLVFVLLVLGNKKNKTEKQNNEDNFEEVKQENQVYVKPKNKTIIENKLNKIDDFQGKVLKKKQPFYAKFIQADDEGYMEARHQINFPSYETTDDDDLL